VPSPPGSTPQTRRRAKRASARSDDLLFRVAYFAAMSAGLRLLIERAGDDHLGTGASVALLGGAALYLLSLVGTRTVTVTGWRRLGVFLKLGAAAIILGLLAVESALPPVAIAAGLAGVLIAVVFAERTLIEPVSPA
jgi:hypothetical protein